ncbi:MAG: cell division protein FtsZ, partial [Solirubrobacterales bacterium]
MIKVVGVGGAGVNAVNRMVEAQVEGVEFLAINTDLQSLQQSAAHETLHIGEQITRGLGSGSNPELGRLAAHSEHDRIKAMLRGSDMVFIAAGAGGGTGTGAAPVVAQIARELDALTVGIVTKPFGFEGSRRMQQAERGIEALAAEVDTLIVVPNN